MSLQSRQSLALVGLLLLNTLLVASPSALSTETQTQPTEDWNIHLQSTYIWQRKAAFNSPYSGPKSLSGDYEKSYSLTGSMALGWRAWQGGELYFNPEVAQGVPMSNLLGLAGFPNGELARTSGASPTFYRARLFLRQTFNLGWEAEYLDSDANQLAGFADKNRLVITAGNLSVLDIFDDNRYSHDPRTQFMNWGLFTHGAYDYAADARGYTWGLAIEYLHDDWAIRAGRFIQPSEPNMLKLDERIFRHYGDQIEFEHSHQLAGQPGKLRLLVFRNRAIMARYDDALSLAAQTGSVPDINLVRHGEQIKHGLGINLEQAITNDIGVFARASWADGKTETYAFTHIDRNLALGVAVQGNRWQRADDTFGLVFSRNGLSAASRNYLAQGGIAFFLGDGQLNYQTENTLETYYSATLCKGWRATLDYQRISHPGYNADRGPVQIWGARLHAEY